MLYFEILLGSQFRVVQAPVYENTGLSGIEIESKNMLALKDGQG